MPQMDQSTFFNVFETLMLTFIIGYSFLSTFLLLPFINSIKIRYELKNRLFFFNFLIIKNLQYLNSFKYLKLIKIKFKN